MGDFGNEYVENLYVLLPLIAVAVIGLPVFGYFYNRLMDSLKGKEHTSIYVVGGVLVTIAVAGLISWKSSLLFLVLFGLDGLPMIIGDYRRGSRPVKLPRRKRLPYAANGLIDDAKCAAGEIHRLMGTELQKHDTHTLTKMQHELTTVLLRLEELKNIQEQ